MKVDVNIIRRPGVKVDINLARGSKVRRVNIPVRVAPYLAEDLPEEENCTPFELVDDAELPEEDMAEEFDSEIEESCENTDEKFDAPVEDECDDVQDIAEEVCEPDPDEEELLRLIEEEEAEMAAASRQVEAEHQPDSHYMSYLDRTSSGDVFEVDDAHASGQKIVCVNSENGRISRVCGFIKNNQPAEAPAADADGQDSE